jgi:hypothetical protein
MAFNSREYEWADIVVNIGGRDIVGIRGVSYEASQEKEPLYGRGNKPISIQKGNKSYKGELVLLQSELEAMRIAAGVKSLLDIQFNMTVGYIPGDTLIIKTDQLKGCQFTSIPKGMKQGDKNMEITMPIVALDLKENV